METKIEIQVEIPLECTWKYVDVGIFGFRDYVYQTSCGKEYDSDKIVKSNFCPNCGKKVK